MHRMYGFPVARGAFPAQRITLASVLVERRASILDLLIKVRMAPGRRDEPDRAVPMFVVVPAHQPDNPGTCSEQGIERLQRISGPVLSVLNSDSESQDSPQVEWSCYSFYRKS
jgi:hypothetical protein